MVALFRELEFRSLWWNACPRPTAPAAPAGAAAAGRRTVAAALQQIALFGGDGGRRRRRHRQRRSPVIRHHLVERRRSWRPWWRRLAAAGGFALDTETTGTDARHCELVGLSLADGGDEGWYIPAGLVTPGSPLVRLLEDATVPKYAHNAKYDLTVLASQSTASPWAAWTSTP